MRKGFIYSIPNPIKQFTYPHTNATREFEELVRVAGHNITLGDRERFIFQMGYEFGLIDGGI